MKLTIWPDGRKEIEGTLAEVQAVLAQLKTDTDAPDDFATHSEMHLKELARIGVVEGLTADQYKALPEPPLGYAWYVLDESAKDGSEVLPGHSYWWQKSSNRWRGHTYLNAYPYTYIIARPLK